MPTVSSSSTAFRTYAVRQGDSLESIAEDQLGDSARWREIAAINRLRYPYVSDHAGDWYGPRLSSGLLVNGTGAGASQLRLPGESAAIVVVGSILFLDGQDEAGRYVYEALVVARFDPTTGVATFAAPSARAWLSGSYYRVFAAPADTIASVARTGQRITLPLRTGPQGAVLAPFDPTTLYGTDIGLDRDGKLLIRDGDLLTVSGFDTVVQAIWVRCQMPFGGYLIHPEEGNQVYDLLGKSTYPETPFRAEIYTAQAILTDPRVEAVTESSATLIAADAIAVNAVVRLASTEEEIELNAVEFSRR
jgi:hypothetical protein